MLTSSGLGPRFRLPGPYAAHPCAQQQWHRANSAAGGSSQPTTQGSAAQATAQAEPEGGARGVVARTTSLGYGDDFILRVVCMVTSLRRAQLLEGCLCPLPTGPLSEPALQTLRTSRESLATPAAPATISAKNARQPVKNIARHWHKLDRETACTKPEKKRVLPEPLRVSLLRSHVHEVFTCIHLQ